jgi:thiosulfate/3-mercaptopyruvate sulfurtransferase
MVRISAAFALVACLAFQTAAAQSPREQLLVTPAWLSAHLTDPNLVLLHVGDKAEYNLRHIPGARFVTLADLSIGGGDAAGLNLQMPPAGSLRDRLVALGVSDSSRVVVYYATSQITQATRIVLTLDYAGLGDKASLLDGGMGAWIGSAHDVTDVLPAPKTGVLAPLSIKPIIVDAAYVKANLKTADVSIVDARLAPFYDGTQVGGSPQAPHKTGHIEGAKSVPWSDLTTDQQTFRPAAEVQDRFTKAGVKPGDTIVAYCHIGQQATAVVFAARTLGFKVLLYDGSFEDWSRQPEAPVATTIKKDR